MDRDDPEKRIADLERKLAERRDAGDPGANRGSQQQGAPTPPPRAGFPLPPSGRSAVTTDGCLTAEQVRSMAFSKATIGKRSYNMAEVDMFLDLVEAALREPAARILTPEQVRSVAFSKPPIGKRGYNEAEVDAFLDRVEEQMKPQQGEVVGQPPQFPDAPTVAGRQSAAPDEPIRCVLFEIFSRRRRWRNALRLNFRGAHPALAMAPDRDAIWVTELTTNALLASARLAQVTATPKNHEPISDALGTMPVLVVSVPGLRPLSIAPVPPGMPLHRAGRGNFWTGVASWRNTVKVTWKYPTHAVTNAEWLTLVQKFGLAPQLDDFWISHLGTESGRQSGSS